MYNYTNRLNKFDVHIMRISAHMTFDIDIHIMRIISAHMTFDTDIHIMRIMSAHMTFDIDVLYIL